MEKFKKILQENINTEITIEYGCIGTGYSTILVVDNGKIKSIGKFIYRLWRELSNWQEVPELLNQLSIESEKYRTGLRDKEPSLCFYKENELKVF